MVGQPLLLPGCKNQTVANVDVLYPRPVPASHKVQAPGTKLKRFAVSMLFVAVMLPQAFSVVAALFVGRMACMGWAELSLLLAYI